VAGQACPAWTYVGPVVWMIETLRSVIALLSRQGTEKREPRPVLGQGGAPGTLLPVRKGRRAPLRQPAGRARGFKTKPRPSRFREAQKGRGIFV
jgi:hypothetical protein